MSDSIVIVGATRTPMGAFQGDFSSLAAHDLGGAAIRAAVQRAGVAPDQVGEVLMGNCLMAGQGQAPARQAAFKGGEQDEPCEGKGEGPGTGRPGKTRQYSTLQQHRFAEASARFCG